MTDKLTITSTFTKEDLQCVICYVGIYPPLIQCSQCYYTFMCKKCASKAGPNCPTCRTSPMFFNKYFTKRSTADSRTTKATAIYS